MSPILRIGFGQYRHLAEVAKREAGSILCVHKYSDKGCWGLTSPMLEGAISDTNYPASTMIEASAISLADRVNLQAFQSANRPEIDWRAIPPDRVYEFLLWHEIGHLRENFCVFELLQQKRPGIVAIAYKVNEVLADRYAWRKLFPNHALPMRPGLSSDEQSSINSSIGYLRRIAPLPRPPAAESRAPRA